MTQKSQPFLFLYFMKIKVPLEIIELESHNYHLLVSSQFADGSEGKWVIDTGASKSVFDQNLPDFYKLLDGIQEELHSAGFHEEPIKSSSAALHLFSLGKMRIDEMKVAVIDLSHINALYSKYSQQTICGLLGGDFLIKYRAVIDYRKKMLVLQK